MEQVLQLLLVYKYVILIPLAIVEGPIVAFLAGVLVSFGYLNLMATFVILVTKDMVMDSVYYYLGKYGDRKSLVGRYGDRIGLTVTRFGFFKKLWETHIFKTMFLGKLPHGLSAPLLVSAGLVGVPVKKFYPYAFLVAFLQYGVLIMLGRYLGDSYMSAASYFKWGEVILFILIVAVVGYLLLAPSLREKVLKE